MTILTYNISLKPFIFEKCKSFFLNKEKSKYIFIDYPDKSKIYEQTFSSKLNFQFISHNQFIKFKNNKLKDKFYLGLDFYQKNLFSEKIYMSILSRYQIDQNTFSYIERQEYFKEILNSYYNFLINNKVNQIIFYDYPHHIDSYILYIIAKYLNIKITIISYLFLLGNYRVVFDKNLKNRFSQFNKRSRTKIDYNHVTKKIERYSRSKSHIKPHYILHESNLIYFLLKDLYRSMKRGVFQDSNFYSKHRYNSKYIEESLPKEITSVFINLKQRIKIKKLKKEYLNLCSNFNFKKKFILFLPSVQPEASTLPLAGFFHDFKLILDMLMKFLPNNWIILYKEHPLTFDYSKESNLFKNSYYYQDLDKNKIKLIDYRLDTYNFIKNAQCIATSTGSAGLEASLKGKAVLNFGCAWWSNFNNIFRIKRDNDLKIALRKINNNEFYFNKDLLYQDIFDTYSKTIEFENYTENSYTKFNKIKSRDSLNDKKIQSYFNKYLS